MFDESLARGNSNEVRRNKVAVKLQSVLQAGTFTYTDVLQAKEPMATDAKEYLDGVKVHGSIPQMNQSKTQNWDGKPILLVHCQPNGRIRGKVTEQEQVPGMEEIRQVSRWKDYGNFAFVDDSFPDRCARMILVREGWGVVQAATQGARVGTVVEWRWLEREAKKDVSVAGVKELYAEILSRPEFRKAMGLDSDAPIESPNQKLGAAKERRPGA